MSAYVIAQVMIQYPTEYTKYVASFMDAFAPPESRVLVAAYEVELLEGAWPKARAVVLQLPSVAHARRCYESPACQSLAKHRSKGATSNMIMAAGFEEPTR